MGVFGFPLVALTSFGSHRTPLENTPFPFTGEGGIFTSNRESLGKLIFTSVISKKTENVQQHRTKVPRGENLRREGRHPSPGSSTGQIPQRTTLVGSLQKSLQRKARARIRRPERGLGILHHPRPRRKRRHSRDLPRRPHRQHHPTSGPRRVKIEDRSRPGKYAPPHSPFGSGVFFTPGSKN